MKQRFIALALLAVCSILLFSGCTIELSNITIQGSGEMVSRTFQVADFDELEIGGSASFVAIFRESSDINVIVEMQENLFDYHAISVRGGRLITELTTDSRINYGNNRPRLYIYAPSLTAINVNGALRAEDWNTIRTPNFSITANGLVNISAHLEVNTLNLSLNGASDLELSGYAHNVYITKNGAGSTDARYLQATDAAVTINGVGGVDIAVSDTLAVTLTGLGSVRYIGNPTVTQSVTAAALGTVRQME